jgi:UDP-N-acetylglucosamine 2-epimerase (non-hydrolysing)
MIGLETVAIGTNEHIGKDPTNLLLALARVMTGQWKTWAIPPRWDGKAAVAAGEAGIVAPFAK